MSIPQSLRDKLREGRVVPFVGAGVSMNVLNRLTGEPVFPNWRKLLLDAADRLEAETRIADANLVRSLLNIQPPDFLDAAKRAKQSLGSVWYRFLKDTFEVEYEKVDPESLDLARRIWRLGSNLVITTNYDDVLRWACPNQADLQTWKIEAPVEQAVLLQQKLHRPVVWHLHGHISDAAQLILSPDGYQLLYPDINGNEHKVKYEAALNTLRNQIASKSLLFVGFSLDDDYLGFQLRSVEGIYKGAIGPHYAIVREEQAERVRSLKIEPLAVSDFGDSLMTLMTDLEAAAAPKATVSLPAELSTKPTVIPDYGPHLQVFYVPFKQKGDEIVGQQEVIGDVRRQLTEGKRTAIGQTAAFRGLGGLGKTQLAIEYAYRYRDQYPNGVIWINADQNIDAQLIEIAEKARWIAPESDHKYKIQIAQQRIRSYSDCLIIFDNLEDLKAIDPYLPEPDANPHILITSRIDHAGFEPVALELLNEKLSRELIVKEARRQPEDEDEERAAVGIVGLLEGLPLALELAGAYLGHRRTITFRQYYELLSTDLKSALPKHVRSFTDHEADLYSTLRLSEGLLQEENYLRDVLDLLTWSGSAPMSPELISRALGIESDGRLVGALAFGAELRLLQQSKDGDSYSLHRLVGEVRREEVSLERRQEWVNNICRRLGDWFQDKREDFSQLIRFESEIDHLKTWQKNAAKFALSHASRLLWLQGYPAAHRGRYIEARDYVREAQKVFDQLGDTNRELYANLLSDLAITNHALGDVSSVLINHLNALTIRRELFGQRHPDIATSLQHIGETYGDQGDLQRALEFSKQALAMRRELLGERHEHVATSLNSVAGWYGKRGDLKHALEYLKQALAIRRELFGERHPDLAISLNDLGHCYGQLGDLQQALEYSQLSLAMQRELFGERHPSIATSLGNLGTLYGKQGNLRRALQFSEQSLAMQRELFGERHPDIATSLGNIGNWYGDQGDLQRALEYSEKGLAMQRDLFGERYPDIAISLNNLGALYGKQGNLRRAVEYSKEALAMQRDLFGERHPDIATSLTTLGDLCERQGNLNDALEYSEQALALKRELFGEKHPDIAISLDSLGNVYLEQGNLQRGLAYSERALVMRRELFGEQHPEIAGSLSNLARFYIREGNLRRAMEYSENALAMQRELFGELHPDIATSLANLGSWYGQQGDVPRALEYSQNALAMQRKLFGERHPYIATSLNNLSGWYGKQRDLTRALEYSEQALAMRRALFGNRHPSTAASLNSLSRCSTEKGDLDRALSCSQEALEIYSELFGEDHTETVRTAAKVAIALNNLRRPDEAYNLIAHFLKVSSAGPARDYLKRLEARLLSTTIRKGFRQPAKAAKRKKKLKRR